MSDYMTVEIPKALNRRIERAIGNRIKKKAYVADAIREKLERDEAQASAGSQAGIHAA